MAYSRREFLVRVGAATFFAGGHYGLIDRMAGPALRPTAPVGDVPFAASALPPEQHLFRIRDIMVCRNTNLPALVIAF